MNYYYRNASRSLSMRYLYKDYLGTKTIYSTAREAAWSAHSYDVATTERADRYLTLRLSNYPDSYVFKTEDFEGADLPRLVWRHFPALGPALIDQAVEIIERFLSDD